MTAPHCSRYILCVIDRDAYQPFVHLAQHSTCDSDTVLYVLLKKSHAFYWVQMSQISSLFVFDSVSELTTFTPLAVISSLCHVALVKCVKVYFTLEVSAVVKEQASHFPGWKCGIVDRLPLYGAKGSRVNLPNLMTTALSSRLKTPWAQRHNQMIKNPFCYCFDWHTCLFFI